MAIKDTYNPQIQAVQQVVAQVMALKDRYESVVMECVANGRLYVSSLQNLNAERQKLRAVAVQHARAHHEAHALDIETQEKLVALCTDAVGVLHQTCVVSFDIVATMQAEFTELKQSAQRTIDTAIENNTEHSDRMDLAYFLVRVKLTRVQSSHLENVVRQMNFLEHLLKEKMQMRKQRQRTGEQRSMRMVRRTCERKSCNQKTTGGVQI